MNCLGNEVESGCVVYSGPDYPQLGVKNGDSLDDVMAKVVQALSSTTTSATSSKTVTTDEITSKSPVRGASSVCAASIVVRDFEYSLSNSATGVVLSYNLMNVLRNLPSGYQSVATRALVTGQPVNGISVISDSRSISSSVTIPVSKYPVTVEFLIRVTAPCGQLDLTYTLSLINPALVGNYRAVMNVLDINPSSGTLNLTDQLNTIESRLQILEGSVQSVDGVNQQLEQYAGEVTSVKETVNSPTNLKINYVKNGGDYSDELGTVVDDLYKKVKQLEDQLTSQQSEVSNLKNTFNSM